ncbi:MAG: hypothetical protein MI723_05740, partial [Caulobacterales bacterium]|nr:hypothetical protein [Caulobacterales bacterium]
GGAVEQALAWTEWGVFEASRTDPDGHASALSEAVALASRVGARRQALGYARAYAGVALHIDDLPALSAARIPHLGVACPDVVAETYVRRAIEVIPPQPGSAISEPAICAYEPLPGAAATGLLIEAARSWRKAAEVAESAAEGRLAAFEDAVPEHVRGLKPSRVIRDLRAGPYGRATLIAADYARRGRARVTRAYAVAAEDGVRLIVSGYALDAPWPPDPLLGQTEAALAAIHDATKRASHAP